MDLILSSGYLAFARHLGVLEALEAWGFKPAAVVGTSSGALVGALLQAGMPFSQIAGLLARRPLASMALHALPWRGLFSTRRIAETLRGHLPERFDQLNGPFAVGVAETNGRHRLLHTGPLLPAVLASMAVPWLFAAVTIDGRDFIDGGVADRVGVSAWRSWRPGERAIVHIVQRSRGRDVAFDDKGSVVIKTPRARARIWSLRDFAVQQREARAIALGVLERAELNASA